ncbi:MAG: hypothetical protein M1816_007498 [Peltula sp. TS41687]|nr:MAG: hypothetical protein M1816_007498 [Peltula sp. TS41687]
MSSSTANSTFTPSSPVGGIGNLFREFDCGHSVPKVSGNPNPCELGRQIPISGDGAEDPLQLCRSCHWRMMFLTEQKLIKDAAERRAAYVANHDRRGANEIDSEIDIWGQVIYQVWIQKWGPPTAEEIIAWKEWLSRETKMEVKYREELMSPSQWESDSESETSI